MTNTNKRQDVLIACYETIRQTSELMLDAAREADWQTVSRGARACNQLLGVVQEIGDPLEVLDAHGQRVRVEILRGVLRADAHIRDLRDPWVQTVERTVLRRRPALHAVK